MEKTQRIIRDVLGRKRLVTFGIMALDEIFTTKSGGKVRIIDQETYDELPEGSLEWRHFESFEIEAWDDCPEEYLKCLYLIDEDDEKEENNESQSSPQAGPVWENLGYIPVLQDNSSKMIDDKYMLYVLNVGGVDKYQIRDKDGDIFYVYKNSDYAPDNCGRTLCRQYKYKFRNDCYFND